MSAGPFGVPLFGRAALTALVSLGRSARLSTMSVVRVFTSGRALAQTARVAVSLALRCVVPTVLVLAPLGGMLALQSLTLMRAFGFERSLGTLITAAIVRELAPGFAAVVVAMQGGAGIAAELGAMRVKSEIDALETMGVDPTRLVVGPRILGAVLSAPLLNFLAVGAGITGAYVVAVGAMGVPHTPFIDDVVRGFLWRDLLLSEGKSAVFGAVTGAVCATAGFYAGRGPAGVGRAAHRGVVLSVMLVLLANYFLNTAVLGVRGGEVPL